MQERGLDGALHLAGPDSISKYDLAVKLAKLFRKESLVIPISEREQLARRPKDASIATVKAESLDIRFTPLRKAIESIEARLRSEGEGRQKER